MTSAKIKEIFSSIQGEGPYIGYKQLFIRFCGCNLHCKYCDTDFGGENSREYTVSELVDIVNANRDCHSVSLTGGEPLLNVRFLKEFLPACNLPVYLETNATLYAELDEIIDYVSFVSADIKLPSCTDLQPMWFEHDKFFEKARLKNLYTKIVFDENITSEEIEKSVELAKKYNIELVIQPKNEKGVLNKNIKFSKQVLNKFLTKYKKVRLIPQVHKYLGVE